MSHQIHQEIHLPGTPERVYSVLTDDGLFSQMTGGAPTKIDAEAGGAFSCFGGMIEGRTIELVAGRRLVQAWRAKPWAPGVYSVVRIELSPESEGTKLTLDHTGFPEGQADHLGQGWNAQYWEPLRRMLG